MMLVPKYEAFLALKREASVGAALKAVLFASMACGGVLAAIEIFLHPIRGILEGFSIYPMSPASDIFCALILYPFFLVLLLILMFVSSQAIYFLAAKLLGGKGAFKQHLRAFSEPVALIEVALNLAIWTGLFSISYSAQKGSAMLGTALSLGALFLLLVSLAYTIRSFYLAFKAVHEFGFLKSLAAILLPAIATILLAKLFVL